MSERLHTFCHCKLDDASRDREGPQSGERRKKAVFGGLIRNLNLTKVRGQFRKKMIKTVWIKVGNLNV